MVYAGKRRSLATSPTRGATNLQSETAKEAFPHCRDELRNRFRTSVKIIHYPVAVGVARIDAAVAIAKYAISNGRIVNDVDRAVVINIRFAGAGLAQRFTVEDDKQREGQS